MPLLAQENVSYAATTTTGRETTLKFKFAYNESTGDLSEEARIELAALPTAKTILITFPLKGDGQSAALHKCYTESHPSRLNEGFHFIQLGSSGIFSVKEKHSCWITRHSKYDAENARAIAEDELLSLGGCVLNLSGLWGGTRQPVNWIDRVAGTRDQLKEKKSLHMIHGHDVARAVLAVHRKFDAAKGERFVSSLRLNQVN